MRVDVFDVFGVFVLQSRQTNLSSRRERVHIPSLSSSVLRQPRGRLVERPHGVAPTIISIYRHLLNLKDEQVIKNKTLNIKQTHTC